MSEISNSEIDVDRLMGEIREAVAKREAIGANSLIAASLELYDLLLTAEEEFPAHRIDLPSLSLQPKFIPSKDLHYHVDDLLKYHDQTFVWNAYRAILMREPDEHGLTQFLRSVRSGRLNKIDVLASLRFSPEGKNKGVRIDGLTRPAFLRKFYRIPVLGYLLEMLAGIVRLPAMVRNQRQFEVHSLAQQQLLVDHINELGRSSFRFSNSFSGNLEETMKAQRNFAELQYQQSVGLFREQRELLQRLRRVEADNTARSLKAPQSIEDPPATNGQPVVQREQRDKERRAFDGLLASFADQFRGEPEKIKEGLRAYLPLLKNARIKRDILDLGCGRGEWLELLREEGLQGKGVENNQVMFEQARSRGLYVVEEEALAYLRDQPSNSFGAITAFHVIEHLSFETLAQLLAEIQRTLRPGGLVILETPNPKNLVVAACNFYSDPTHHKPIFPETLRFLLQQKGFVGLSIEYRNPVEDSPFDDEQPASRALHSWFFGPRDFAMIGRKKKGILSGMTLQVGLEDRMETIHLASFESAAGHEFYARPQTDDSRIFSTVVDLDEYSLPPEFGKQDVVIDIGAHIGSFSYAVLERGAGKVYAYEAHPVNHAITRKNLERFGERANCSNLAVWRSDVSGETLFNDRLDDRSDPNTGGHAVLYNNDGLPIRTIGLDDILFEASDGLKRRIRLLKIDCEGAEYPILMTAKHLKIIEEICGEYHEIAPEAVPERARVEGMPERLDGHALKNFLEGAGWSVKMEPNTLNPALGHFRAFPKVGKNRHSTNGESDV